MLYNNQYIFLLMKLIPIIEEQNSAHKFPRLNKEFIGIGHELENKRKNRRKI